MIANWPAPCLISDGIEQKCLHIGSLLGLQRRFQG